MTEALLLFISFLRSFEAGMKVVPRYEWRTFASELPEFEKQLDSFKDFQTKKSDEVYLLTANTNINIKIRADFIDVKVLKHVNEEGLELWEPILKEKFPVITNNIIAAFGSLGLNLSLEKIDSPCSLENFLRCMVKNAPAIRLVNVSKVRKAYTVDACMVEIASVSFDSGPWLKTAAIEATDPREVSKLLKKFKFRNTFQNMNYLAALKKYRGTC